VSRDDLLADLQGAVSARPAAPPTSPGLVPSGEAARLTPAVDVAVTPLRWRLPSFRPAAGGLGIAVRLGPLTVTVSVR
jgi:hypothetical protein